MVAFSCRNSFVLNALDGSYKVNDVHLALMMMMMMTVMVIMMMNSWCSLRYLESNVQDRREAFEAQGHDCKMRSSASKASKQFFGSCPLHWLKTQFETFPTTKMLNILNYEALGPTGKLSPGLLSAALQMRKERNPGLKCGFSVDIKTMILANKPIDEGHFEMDF